MKSIITIYIILFSVLASAQTIVNLDGTPTYEEQGKYYKDINNVLNPFVGTYLYTNGTTSFKIILQKKENSSFNNYYYEDMLIGGYQYIENGIEKVNTLSNLNNNHSNGVLYDIHANNIMTGNGRGQTGFSPTEKWVTGYIDEPSSDTGHEIFFIRTTVNGQEAVKIFISSVSATVAVPENTLLPSSPNYPTYEYLELIKQ